MSIAVFFIIAQTWKQPRYLWVDEWIKNSGRELPGGTVDKNLPANAGDMSSIPGPGRSHMPWSN